MNVTMKEGQLVLVSQKKSQYYNFNYIKYFVINLVW